MSDILNQIRKARIIAVVTIADERLAVKLARTLYDAGIRAMEITLRTNEALSCIKQVKNEIPKMLLCAGTLLTPLQVDAVVASGADFAVAPGCNPRILKAAAAANLFFAPGVSTASEIEIAMENGCRLLKYFPAETSGGIKHLEILASPFLHLMPQFIPLGGLTQDNSSPYFQSPLVAAVGGSWIAPTNWIADGNWTGITANATKAADFLNRIVASPG